MVEAAAHLLIESGPSAITHRRVAEAAGVPLGSANYFFPSRAQLYAFAVEAAEASRVRAATEFARGLPRARRSPAATADLLIRTWYAPHVDHDVVRARLEPMIDALHSPELRRIMNDSRPALVAALETALERSGYPQFADVELVALLLDSALTYANSIHSEDAYALATDALARLLTLIAPLSSGGASAGNSLGD